MHEVSSACWHQGLTLTLTLTTRYSYRLDGNVEHGEPEEAERVAELCRLLSTDQADARPLDLLGLRLGVGVRLRVRLGVRLRVRVRVGIRVRVGFGFGFGFGFGVRVRVRVRVQVGVRGLSTWASMSGSRTPCCSSAW